ncbi:tRNA 2-selenouridine(34) synthase MnmH [Aromatoleum petrolei]|uniref:tRNA 2-selenouridine(34) synthase MnmH n=1 Tax=Aromatoleum petrolei TaxID=76116 RepID=A0ABX1MSH4_9RHOO|nr:tRNA 2-selenouridine(34) synthase MnmH [Aromatoleum petrolei]NMF89276.1 tRNA 2-selenouridine(34) synthase MnmH [Aromatoleum petrolei]QTQ35029.1 tRNA 2-selenouridine synthase [Aromatoleum petrolei]
MKKGIATVAQLDTFDEFIDARSPAEFEEDHIPGAISCPVLDNEQRAIVGTIYKQQSAFEARRIGAAMVAENIARHLRERFQDKPKDWRPLVYCWRGGQRSGSFVTWLRLIGWDACQLEGGYKNWRRMVVTELETLPQRFDLRVLCGATGSGKTRVLEQLAALGAQVLDLEDLAAHKGSVLGALPDRPQPTQKSFETRLYEKLHGFDPARPVFVEAESRKIGRIHLPEGLIAHMRASACVAIEAARDARIEFLVRDYDYLGDDVPDLQNRIEFLRGLQSNEVLERWKELARQRDLHTLYGEFIDLHYDPLYRRSQNRNFARFPDAPSFACDDLTPAGIHGLAQRILAAQA